MSWLCYAVKEYVLLRTSGTKEYFHQRQKIMLLLKNIRREALECNHPDRLTKLYVLPNNLTYLLLNRLSCLNISCKFLCVMCIIFPLIPNSSEDAKTITTSYLNATTMTQLAALT